MKCSHLIEMRRKCTGETNLEGKEVRNTIVITFAFQVVFTAFNALQNLHSSLHDEGSLGDISIAIMSGTAIVSSVLSPTIIGLIGAKSSVVAFFGAHCIYVLANYYPSFSTMAPAAVAVGAFQGPAWTSQALYISASAFSFSKSSTASPYSILSRFNGFFFAVFASSQIVGNLVTSTVIRDGVDNSTDEILVKSCGSDDCPSSENATVIEDPEDWVIQVTLGFFMGCTLLGLLMAFFLLSPLPRSEWIQRVSVRSTTTSCFNVLVSNNMVLLTPFIMFTAIENAFLRSAFTKSYVACPIGLHMVGYVMASYGATTPLLILFVTRLARIAGRFILLASSLTVHIALFIVLLFWSPTPDDEVPIFIIPMVWGVAESILHAQANALMAMLFSSQKEPAFANFHAWRSLGFAITFLNMSYMCVYTKLLVCIAFGCVGTLLYIIVEIRTKVKEKLALKRPRESIASTHLELEMRRENGRASVSSNRTSVSSLHSLQDRLSFERVELTEIINEAQQSWTRNEEGLTLEMNRVMSAEHLASSKVTNWFHNTPVSSDFSKTPEHPPTLIRSLSDGHLNYAAVKVDAAIVKMRRGRNSTIGFSPKRNIMSVPKRRHVSDINPPNLYIISENIQEEDEYTMEMETEIDSYGFHDSRKDDNVFELGNDDIDEEEEKEIMHYRNLLRRFSKTLNKESLGQSETNESEAENDSASNVSHSSSTQDFQDDHSEANEQKQNEKIIFTMGTTPPVAKWQYNQAFDSDDNDDTLTKLQISTSRPFPQRSISYDSSYLHQQTNEMGRNTYSLRSSLKLKPDKSQTEEKRKRKISSVFKGFRSSKKGKKDDMHTTVNDKVQDQVDGEGEKKDDSDADSDGWIDYEQDDNEDYHNYGTNDMGRAKSKKKVPVSEAEDINSIY